MMIIQRPELTEQIEDLDKWTMVYGRRKTGKTFLLREFIQTDEYFFVKRDRTIFSEKDNRMKNMTYDTFEEILQRELANGKTLVVDEFHRLGDDFFDLLHSMRKDGRLILVSSTLSLSKKMIGKRSPLMGLFAEVPVPIISLKNTSDTIKDIKDSKKELMELSMILREPITIDYVDKRKSARNILTDILMGSLKTIPALVGEIFREENRQLSSIYEGILRAISAGKSGSGQIADHMFSHNMISKNDPSLVQQYLVNMVEFGVLKKIKIFNKNRYKYTHSSALTHLYYYADEHYNISERNPTRSEIQRIADDVIPHLIESTMREHLAQKHGLDQSVVEKPDYDIDVCLLRFKKPEIIGEVKWKDKVSRKDVNRAEEVLSRFDAEKRFLFVPDKSEVSSDRLDVIDVNDL